MIRAFFDVGLAALLAYLAAWLGWWVPLLVFPLVLGFSPTQNAREMSPTRNRALLDFLLMLLQIGWIIGAAIICYSHFETWWGALIGVLLGFMGASWAAPRRWATEIQE